MICTAAKKSACWAMKATATPKSVVMRQIAACTGFFTVMTPTAPPRMSSAEVAKTRMAGIE